MRGERVFLAVLRKAINSLRRGNFLDLGIMKLLYREFGATLGAATGDDEAALVGSHALEKTMSIATFDFFGLVSAFHNLVVSY